MYANKGSVTFKKRLIRSAVVATIIFVALILLEWVVDMGGGFPGTKELCGRYGNCYGVPREQMPFYIAPIAFILTFIFWNYEVQDIAACVKCGKSTGLKEATPKITCKYCGGKLERIKGFYDRHPKFRHDKKDTSNN